MDLLGLDFDEKLKLYLCGTDKKPFMLMRNIEEVVRTMSLVGVDELEFSIPRYRPHVQGGRVENELYDLVRGDMYLLFDDGTRKQYFIVQNPVEEKDKTGNVRKTVTAYSGEYYFANKKVDNYDLPSRLLYDETAEKDDEGFYTGFLNFVEERTTWSIEHVSAKLMNKYRELRFSNRSLLDCLKSCGEIYDAVFFFDTVKETISAYHVSEVGGHQGICISDKNFIEDIKKNVDTQGIKTRLIAYGADDMGIHTKNVTGKPYIDDISYYIEFGFASKDLIRHWEAYQQAVKQATPEYEKLFSQVMEQENALSKVEIALREVQGEIRKTETLLDTAIVGGNETERRKLQEAQNLLEKEVKKKTKQIQDIKEQMKTTLSSLRGISERLDTKKFFTEETGKEYDRYIKEEIIKDNSFVRGMEEDLYHYAKEQLEKLCYPVFSFDVSVVDFRKIAQFRQPMARLKLGDFVRLECQEMGVLVDVRLFEAQVDYEAHSIRLSFGNKYASNDPNLYLSELLGRVSSISTNVSFKDFIWSKGAEAKSAIAAFLSKNLDLAKQAIVTAEHQRPILDSRGLWLLKENPDGTIDNAQVRGIHNVIAFTDDNWKTVKTAISGRGIHAEHIVGRLGSFVTVNANQVFVSDTGLSPESSLGRYLDKKEKELKEDVDSTNKALKGQIDHTLGGVKDKLDKAVLEGKTYNAVAITPQKGIEVKDAAGRQRVQIGEWASGHYGLKILSADGHRTVLDDRGMLQTWQVGGCENLDHQQPFTLSVFIPESASEIHRVHLRFKKLPFRAYSKAADMGGYSVQTSAAATGGEQTATTEIDYFNDYREYDSYNPYGYGGKKGHNHGVDHGSNLRIYDGYGVEVGTRSFSESGGHTHKIKIPESEHTHKVTLPPHGHEIDFGIYELPLRSHDVSLSVNGRFVSVGRTTYGNFYDVEITAYMQRGWNSIEFHVPASSTTKMRWRKKPYATPVDPYSHWGGVRVEEEYENYLEEVDGSQARIDATVFVQALMNF